MADSTQGAQEVAAETEVESVLVGGDDATAAEAAKQATTVAEKPAEVPTEKPEAPAEKPETPEEAPKEASVEDRLAALERALKQAEEERDAARKASEEARLEQARSKALTDAGLSDDYAIFLDGNQEDWGKKLELLAGLKGVAEKKPVSVPRDPVMESDMMDKNNLTEQAAGFFGLL